MPFLVDIALFGWFGVVLWLFKRYPYQQAVIAAVMLGYMFLPEVKMYRAMEGMPDAKVILILKFTKFNVIAFSALVGAMVFDLRRLLAFRPNLWDLPMAVWCILPFFSNILNDEPPYLSFGQMRDAILMWGVPYFLGRVYFPDLASFRAMTSWIIMGGLLYVPFCLFEILKSPYVHWRVYGYFPNDPSQSERYGGFRPVVFMEHGLAVGMWMAVSAVVATWLWKCGTFKQFVWWHGKKPFPMMWVAAGLLTMAVLVKSTGAIGLGAVALVILFTMRRLKFHVAMAVLLAISPLYMYLRISGAWTGQDLVQWVETNLEKDRALSLDFRMKNENILMAWAMNKPWLGWGDTGLGQKVPLKNKDDDKPVTDGLWIMALGNLGIVGLTGLYAAFLLPAARFTWQYKPKEWCDPGIAPAAVMAIVMPVFMIDCLFNSMINPVWLVSAGALTTLTCNGKQRPAVPTVVQMTEDLATIEEPPPDGDQANEASEKVRRPGILVRKRPFSK